MECFRPGGLELTKKALDKIELCPGDRVLDIGCGLGTSLEYITKVYKADVYGLDVEKKSTEKAAKRLGNGRVICADACALPYADNSFSLVLMECVLTLVPEAEKALKEALRVLLPGGAIIISALTGSGDGRLCSQGRMDLEALDKTVKALGARIHFCSDETALFRHFVAEMIFRYDSLENYISHANQSLGGSILDCSVQIKGTGYTLLIIKKAQ